MALSIKDIVKTGQKLLDANPGLSARDMRDLLMEHDIPGDRASQLTASRLDAEHRAQKRAETDRSLLWFMLTDLTEIDSRRTPR